MVIHANVDENHPMPLAKAAKTLPTVRGEKPPHPMTLRRWATIGIKSASGKRIKLETSFVGATRMTTVAALKRFFSRRDDLEFKELPVSAEREQRQREKQAAESMLRMKAAGLLPQESVT
jgi:hypothetical protein